MNGRHSYRKKLCLDIAALEQSKIGQAQYRFNGINIWPVLRADLCKSVEDAVLAQGRVFANLQPALRQFKERLYHIDDAANDDFAPRFVSDFEGDNSGRQRLLFHTRAMRHQVQASGESACGQIDFLYRLLEQDFECVKVEEFTWRARNLHPRFVEPYYFDNPFDDDLMKSVNALPPEWRWPEENDVQDNYNALFEAMGVVKDVPKFSRLQSRLSLMHVYAHVYYDMLQRFNPAAVFTELYYNPEVWGLYLAAKRLGIPTIEVQHGLVGRYQWIMTHWSSIPDLDNESGFDLLPDYFWCFDEETAENLLDANNGEASFQPFVGGIAKLNYWASRNKELLRKDYRQYLADLHNSDFVVLVALNYQDYAPENVISAIKRLPKTWRWLIRLHPMSIPAQEEVEQTYRALGVDNVEFHYATRVPIYDLLGAVDHLVTGYSTIATEALPFGVGVTLTDTIGPELYPQFVADGRMSVGLVDDALISILKLAASKAVKTACEETSSAINDQSASVVSRLLEDHRRRSGEVERRKNRLSEASLFLENPIDWVKEKQSALHITNGVSILPLVYHRTGRRDSAQETAAELLDRLIVPQLEKFGARLATDAGIDQKPSKPAATDLLFYELRQSNFVEQAVDQKKPRLLFISRAEQYRYDGRKFFLGPFEKLIDDFSAGFDVIKTEIYNAAGAEVHPRRRAVKFLRTPWAGDASKFTSDFQELFSSHTDKDVADAIQFLESAEKTAPDDKRIREVRRDIALSCACARAFQTVLAVEQPAAVFIDDKPVPENWGAILAAKNVGLPVVQIMPSQLSACLTTATDQRRHIDGADGFLPDYYWCLGQDSTKDPNANAYLNYVVSTNANGEGRAINEPNDLYTPLPTQEEMSYRKFIQAADKAVLIALSDDCSIPGLLMDTMRSLPRSWLWVIRTPRSALRGASVIAEQFVNAGIVNFELEFASRRPLVELAMLVDGIVAVNGSIDDELTAAGIDFILLDEKGDRSANLTKQQLMQALELSSRQNKPVTANSLEATAALFADWQEKAAERELARPKLDAFFGMLPSIEMLWRRDYLHRDVRTSKFALIPQDAVAGGSAVPKKKQSNAKPASPPPKPLVTTTKKSPPPHTLLNHVHLPSAVQHFGSRKTLKIAFKLAIWSFRQKVSPRRRVLNAYRKWTGKPLVERADTILAAGKPLAPTKTRIDATPDESTAPKTLTLVAELALLESDDALFALVQDVDRRRRDHGFEDCHLVISCQIGDGAKGSKNWNVYSRIVPVFSSLSPHVTSIRIVPGTADCLVSLEQKSELELYRWDESEQQRMSWPRSTIPNLLHDQYKPIAADEESKRFASQWRVRVCDDQTLVTMSFGDGIGTVSDDLIALLNEVIELLRANNIEIVILPSPADEFDALRQRMTNASSLDECRHNMQLRTAVFEVADLNILIGDGVNALAALNASVRWCYFTPTIERFGPAMQERQGNIVFEEMPQSDALLGLIRNRTLGDVVEQRVQAVG